MGDVVIRAEGLGKRYRVGAAAPRYRTLRDSLSEALKAPLRRLRRGRAGGDPDRTFWALKDVSFDVRRGEVVGVIGRNGAGKSTLLKILSRITEPTEGGADLHGRVGSLLEVGTGFNPELTGRENTFLNGAILGMRRDEIRRKFDEIVAFAEVERFIDTPVKHYSSGMYMRLAFAVAAHLEPEILVVDEVLAVGDAEFQKKCLGKMSEVGRQGRTVLFVSHNMHAIRMLCQRCLVLQTGRLVCDGETAAGIDRYLGHLAEGSAGARVTVPRPAAGPCWISSIRGLVDGQESSRLPIGGRLAFEVEFSFAAPTRTPRLGFIVAGKGGEAVLNSNNRYLPFDDPPQPVRLGKVTCDLGAVPLMPGHYYVTFVLGDHLGDHHVVRDQLVFEVVERDIWGRGHVPPSGAGNLWWPTGFRFEPGPDTAAAAERG